MPDVYTEGQQIPELGGVVRGGVTVVLHHPDEMEGLQALCLLAGRPPEEPLHAISQALTAPGLDLRLWTTWKRRLLPYWGRENGDSLPASGTAIDDWEALPFVLSLIHDIWAEQGEEVNQLCVTMSIPDPTENTDRVLELESEMSALVFHRGSIQATLKKAKETLKVTGYAVAIAVRYLLRPKLWAPDFVETLRRKAEQSQNVEQLGRLDQVSDVDQLRTKRGVIIFLHGLLSTDVGLFDSLIRRLKTGPDIRDHVAIIGWPHNTLAKIDENGLDLYDLITDVIGLGGPKVAFVCHSRGGLVARSVATKLYTNSMKWKDQLRGCVTFGTPHQGAGLAAYPHRFLGTFVVGGHTFQQNKSLSSLVGTLLYSERYGTQGIEDLRPPKEGGDFLTELSSQERKQEEGKLRALNIFAVGGAVSPRSNLFHIMSNYALATSQHDLIVETISSTPPVIHPFYRPDCDHFSYFTEYYGHQEHLGRAVSFLKDMFEMNHAASP
jgi:hypothetical protein